MYICICLGPQEDAMGPSWWTEAWHSAYARGVHYV